MGSNDTKRGRANQRGIGLYTHEQEKNTTAFDYFAQIVVGAIIAAVGGLLLYQGMIARSEQIRAYSSADTHIWAWVGSVAVVVIGIFMAHAGVIFYARRIARRVFGSAHKSQNR